MIDLEYILRSPSYYLHSREIILYGAGYEGRLYFNHLSYMGANVIAFCDTFQKGRFCDLPILDICGLKKTISDKYIIISSSSYRDEILLTLKDHGLDSFILDIENEYLAQLLFSCIRAGDFGNEKIGFNIHNLLLYFRNSSIRRKSEEIIFNNPLLIYTFGKVGSKTLYESFQKSIPVVHIHYIYRYCHSYFCESHFSKFLSLLRNRPVKIITVVREPLSQVISRFFHLLHKNSPLGHNDFEDIKEELGCFLEESRENNIFSWFEEELEKVFELNVFEFPFDKEKGYTIIKKDNIEILLLKLEKMNDLIDVIGDFGGVESFALENRNVANMSPYAEFYKEAKEKILFDKDYVDLFYRYNSKFDYFYSKEEKLGFLKKWRKNLPEGYEI